MVVKALDVVCIIERSFCAILAAVESLHIIGHVYLSYLQAVLVGNSFVHPTQETGAFDCQLGGCRVKNLSGEDTVLETDRTIFALPHKTAVCTIVECFFIVFGVGVRSCAADGNITDAIGYRHSSVCISSNSAGKFIGSCDEAHYHHIREACAVHHAKGGCVHLVASHVKLNSIAATIVMTLESFVLRADNCRQRTIGRAKSNVVFLLVIGCQVISTLLINHIGKSLPVQFIINEIRLIYRSRALERHNLQHRPCVYMLCPGAEGGSQGEAQRH